MIEGLGKRQQQKLSRQDKVIQYGIELLAVAKTCPKNDYMRIYNLVMTKIKSLQRSNPDDKVLLMNVEKNIQIPLAEYLNERFGTKEYHDRISRRISQSIKDGDEEDKKKAAEKRARWRTFEKICGM
jgi:hypothetical protein